MFEIPPFPYILFQPANVLFVEMPHKGSPHQITIKVTNKSRILQAFRVLIPTSYLETILVEPAEGILNAEEKTTIEVFVRREGIERVIDSNLEDIHMKVQSVVIFDTESSYIEWVWENRESEIVEDKWRVRVFTPWDTPSPFIDLSSEDKRLKDGFPPTPTTVAQGGNANNSSSHHATTQSSAQPSTSHGSGRVPPRSSVETEVKTINLTNDEEDPLSAARRRLQQHDQALLKNAELRSRYHENALFNNLEWDIRRRDTSIDGHSSRATQRILGVLDNVGLGQIIRRLPKSAHMTVAIALAFILGLITSKVFNFFFNIFFKKK